MLEVINLNKDYDKNHVLKNINFKVFKGEIIGIIGGSGSGKSTLLRCIDKIEDITTGEIHFNNENILKIDKYHQKVGMVFQQFNLFPHLTVLENIILAPLKLKLMTKNDAVKRAKELLKEINLYGKIDSYPNNLSGGEKQRVAIVRTLIMNPEIILFDEPTSSLDPKMTKDVLDLIKKLIPLGITIIIVSHELNFIKEIANRVIFIDDGKIVSDDTNENTFINSKNKLVKEFISSVE